MQTTDGHTLCLLRCESDRCDLFAGLLSRAFKSREAVLILAADPDQSALFRQLKQAGLELDVRLRSGQVKVVSNEMLRDDSFDLKSSRALEMLHDLYVTKINEGYGSVRFVVEATELATGLGESKALMVFEASLNAFTAERSCSVMTLYRLDQMDRGLLPSVLRAPRQVAIGQEIVDNPYYTPARDLFGDASGQTLFNQMLDHIDARRSRDTLLDNEDLLRALFREIDVGFVLFQAYPELTAEGKLFQVVQANPIFEEINGVKPGDLVGSFAGDVFPSMNREVIDIFTEVALTGQSARFEQFQPSSGRYFEIIAFRPKERLCAALVTDVSERHRLEETRQKSEFRIRQTQKMEAIGRLASGVAHDFNNILTAIVGLTNVLMEEIPSENPQWEDVDQIRKAADRAAALTRQLLAFSRKQKISPKVVNLNRVIEDASKMLSRIIGEDICLTCIPGENLKAVKVDPGQIEQILANFAANARDAMPHGGKLVIETRNVTTDTHLITPHGEVLPGSYVRLTTRDTGVGMTEEIMDRIFEPFFTTKEKGKGTGLGLATVYGIVRQNEGSILVHSTPGEGTVFDVYFPLAEALPAEDSDFAPIALPKGSATVLVAEDEDTVRNLTTRILERNGYRVVSAANAEEALALWPEWRGAVDFLLTDVIMPGLNGLELFNRLRDDKPGLRVLYMTGYPEDVLADQGVSANNIQLLEKPFSPNKLLYRIREILEVKGTIGGAEIGAFPNNT